MAIPISSSGFLFNTSTNSDQDYLTFAALPDGCFVVTWWSCDGKHSRPIDIVQ